MAQYKITLDSGKVVIMREFTIRIKNNAIEVVSSKSSARDRAFDSLMQDEIIRQLLVSIDGKIIGNVEREDLDNIMTIEEYTEILLSLRDVMGGNVTKKPKLEIITTNS